MVVEVRHASVWDNVRELDFPPRAFCWILVLSHVLIRLIMPNFCQTQYREQVTLGKLDPHQTFSYFQQPHLQQSYHLYDSKPGTFPRKKRCNYDAKSLFLSISRSLILRKWRFEFNNFNRNLLVAPPIVNRRILIYARKACMKCITKNKLARLQKAFLVTQAIQVNVIFILMNSQCGLLFLTLGCVVLEMRIKWI